MKRSCARILCLCVVLLLAVACAASAARPKGAYFVNPLERGSQLNVHGEPGLDNVIDKIKPGTVVQYRDCDDGWWKIQWWNDTEDVREGYVDSSYLTSIVADPEAQYAPVCGLYIHSEPRMDEGTCYLYHTGEILKKGRAVTVQAQEGMWALVSGVEVDVTGWVPSIYLKKIS